MKLTEKGKRIIEALMDYIAEKGLDERNPDSYSDENVGAFWAGLGMPPTPKREKK